VIGTLLQTLTPVFFLIATGVFLRHIRFLDANMESALNRLAYWVALPLFITIKMAQAPIPKAETLQVCLASLLITVLMIVAAYVVAALFRFKGRGRGALVHVAFRGNIAYVGLPVIAFALRNEPQEIQLEAQSLAILIMTPLVLFYNLLAVMVLEWERRHEQESHPVATWLKASSRNPLILASVLGLILNVLLNLFHVSVPKLIGDCITPLGSTAFPLALLAIGARIRSLSLAKAGPQVLVACLLKNLIGVLVGWGCIVLMGLEGLGALVLLVFSATPTAVASYVLVDQLDGDRDLTAAAIAGTTLMSLLSLSAGLWLYIHYYGHTL